MKLHPDVTNPRVGIRFKTLEADLYEIWGDKLSFDESVYGGMHAEFWYYCNRHKEQYKTKPYGLLQGRGCPDCGHEARARYSRSQAIKAGLEFAEKCELIHPNKYLYHLVKYVNNHTKVEIWCIACQCSFWVTPNQLLRSSGCERCGARNMAEKQSAEARLNFPAKAELIHPNKNYYHLVDYKNAHVEVELWCVGCECSYWITPNHVLKGYWHSACTGGGGFKYDKPSIVYYLRVETRNQVAYKIGITNRSVEERFSDTDLEMITIINIEHFKNGKDAYDKEQSILKQFKEFQYQGDMMLESGGNTELFSKDVLNLDIHYH